jgi:hypothetical protein
MKLKMSRDKLRSWRGGSDELCCWPIVIDDIFSTQLEVDDMSVHELRLHLIAVL